MQATPTPVPTPTPVLLEEPTPVPTIIPVVSVAKKPVKKHLAVRTFPLPPLPSNNDDGSELRVFIKGVLKQLTDGRTRVIAASHKMAGEYANANELIYDGGLLKETVTSAQKATYKSMVDCAKLSQYTKNAFAALKSLREKNGNSSIVATDFAQQLPEIDRIFVTLMLDLNTIKLNLEDLEKNADSANTQYLNDGVQSGLTSLRKVSDDILDLKTAVGNLGSSLHNISRNP